MENRLNGHPTLHIETVATPEGGEVSFCPERGGIITSLKFQGTEVLYLEQDTLQDSRANVRGGIPILFPNAGPIESVDYPNLKQHGFARNSPAWKALKSERGFTEALVADEETKKMFPYEFRLTLEALFEVNGSFSIREKVENPDTMTELPLAMGLHPYFKVPSDKKGDMRFNFEGGTFVEEHVAVWSNGKAISIDNPKLKDPFAVMEVVIPTLGTLTIDPSPEFKKVWMWSLPEKDFVCIEPVMRDSEGLVTDPQKIKTGETLHTRVNFTLRT